MVSLEQIDKDVRRTLPDFSFFQTPVPECAFSEKYMMSKEDLRDVKKD